MSSIDIAKWFIVNNQDVANESMDSKIKLQKLLYYSQAMYLAVTEDTLFAEKIEAWKFGPVVREVYRHVQYENLISTVNFLGASFNDLDSNQLQVLKTINFIYGQKSSHELVELTHTEAPWKSLEERAMKAENPIISVDTIRDYYRPLKAVFDSHKDFDFDSHKADVINGNRFVYNFKETMLNDVDINDLWELGLDDSGESFYLYKDINGELVVY